MLAELHEQSDTVEPTPEEQERAGWVHCVLDIIRSDFEDSTFQCFWRYYVDDEDPANIAADLGMKPATARAARNRVVKRFREVWAELFGLQWWPFPPNEPSRD